MEYRYVKLFLPLLKKTNKCVILFQVVFGIALQNSANPDFRTYGKLLHLQCDSLTSSRKVHCINFHQEFSLQSNIVSLGDHAVHQSV